MEERALCTRRLVVECAGWDQLARPISQHDILVSPTILPGTSGEDSSVAPSSGWLAVGPDGRANLLLPLLSEGSHVC